MLYVAAACVENLYREGESRVDIDYPDMISIAELGDRSPSGQDSVLIKIRLRQAITIGAPLSGRLRN